ncbi:hypothetical protein BG844_17930 [Couchioplanes caeruleus subsp. caeruleus]|uniref:Peptidase MA superfamily protein n=2 Tax=Couchioplanes caeruleus TaxID=56438 RepID=A0A1K0GPA5_9ACTN|nr:hypothetical protein BG844_17930 [Couchioplanes caeruleus subsp. caeruleus]
MPGYPAPPFGAPGWMPPQPPARSGRGRWIGLSLVAVLVTMALGAGVGLVAGVVHNGGRDDAVPVAKDQGNLVQVTREETDKLVQAQSDALKAKDLKRFLAAFDPSDKKLIAGQTRLFKNLQKMPFSEVGFKTVGQDGRAADGFGRGVRFDLDVAFVHQIKDIDLRPVAEWYRWTVTKADRNARLVIKGVTGAPASAYGDSKTVNYPAPWDKWDDIAMVRTAHTIVLAEPAAAGSARQYAPIAERAVADNLAAWKAGGVAGEIPTGYLIALVKGKKQLGTLFRDTREKVFEAGVSITMSGGRFTPDDPVAFGGSRIVVDIQSSFFTTGGSSGPREIFRHELAHSMVTPLDAAKLFQDRDGWIREGFADYMAYRGVDGPSQKISAARAQIAAGGFTARLPVGDIYQGSLAQVNFGYWLGHMAMEYTARQYGEPAVFKLVAAHYRGKSDAEAITEATGQSKEQFEQGWAQFVRAQAR